MGMDRVGLQPVLFWDFDGTLVKSPHLWSTLLLRALKGAWPDCPHTLEDVRPLLRTGFPWHTPDADLSHMKGEAWWDCMYRHFEIVCLALNAPDSAAHKAARAIRCLIRDPELYALYPDTLSALDRCQRLGFAQYIVSNNHPDLAYVLDSLRLSPWFQGVIVSGELGVDKPRREIFQYALDMAGRPGLCFMIGDNPYADGEGAKNAGIPPLLVHPKEPAPGFPCFDTLAGIADYLQEALHAASLDGHFGL